MTDNTQILPVGDDTRSAVSANVQAVLLRPFTTNETIYVDALLARARRMIERAAISHGTTIDALDAGAVIDVQADMVARVLRNPEGVRTESDGQYSYQLDSRAASGRLELTDEDMATLGLTDTRLWVWNPTYGTPR